MAAWVVENRRMTTSRLNGRKAFQAVVGLALGFILGVVSILWVLWIGRMFKHSFHRWLLAKTHRPDTSGASHDRAEQTVPDV